MTRCGGLTSDRAGEGFTGHEHVQHFGMELSEKGIIMEVGIHLYRRLNGMHPIIPYLPQSIRYLIG